MLPRILLIFHSRFEESAEMLKGIMHYQRARGGWSMFLHDGARLGIDPCPWVRSRPWQGVISCHTTPNLIEACSRLRLPLVDLANSEPVPGVSKVRPDDGGIGQLGATYLLERRFGHFGFCGYGNIRWSTERCEGFLAVVGRTRHRCEVFDTEQPDEMTPSWDAKQMTMLAGWLKCMPSGAAVMACDDFRAEQVLRAAKATGIQVPDEVAVLGVNNFVGRCEATDPSLSSVVIDAFESGWRAAQHLDHLMTGGNGGAIDVRIPPSGVVTRKSTDVLGLRDKVVAEALNYIKVHACAGITVDQVLHHASVSRSQLEHKLRRYIGRSPQAEIRRVQVARICELLIETNLHLKEIAQQTGFAHVEYLNVVFKRVTGETPGQYRAKNAQKYWREPVVPLRIGLSHRTAV
jgi:LacI family transcriptional regulator